MDSKAKVYQLWEYRERKRLTALMQELERAKEIDNEQAKHRPVPKTD